jgi:ribonuclease Z
MARVTLLGSAATLANRQHDTIYLLVEHAGGALLIDCGGSPIHKLERAGVGLRQVTDILLTHDHTDHLYGLPLLVQGLMLYQWSGQWSGELRVWGLWETLATARALLKTLGLWERIEIDWRPIPAEAGQIVIESADLRVLTAPVEHMRPTLGVRLEGRESGRVVAYSSDSEPCAAVVALARGADVLLHEATNQRAAPGHSTPAEAGQVAARAGAGRLVLVHFDPHLDPALLCAQAAQEFGGPVEVGQDWMVFDLQAKPQP